MKDIINSIQKCVRDKNYNIYIKDSFSMLYIIFNIDSFYSVIIAINTGAISKK